MNTSEFLALLEVPEGTCRFVIGPFDPGITLLRQQTRALNLIYCLSKEKKLQKNSKIAVIGGGVAGITAAVAAATQGCEVHLIERTHSLLHLQRGCDIRWIHPHIYTWPEPESEREYAGLPLLDWRSSTASNVANQILENYKQIKIRPGIRINEYFGSELTSVENFIRQGKPRVRVSWNSIEPKSNKNSLFDIVVFAVGFGIEKDIDHRWPSYWRNDSIHQVNPRLKPGEKTQLLISGTGDGGLIDLMRATISDFDHSSIHETLFPSQNEDLRNKLSEIRKLWFNNSEEENNNSWLYDQYAELEETNLLGPALIILRNRLRPDTEVTLNGHKFKFPDCLRLDTASMFSTLVAYCLWHLKAFSYIQGCIDIKDQTVLINKRLVHDKQIILRHGANTLETYMGACCLDVGEIIKSQDRLRKYFNTAKPLWEAGWWSSKNGGIEPVSPPTVALATTFVSTLRDMLQVAIQPHNHDETLSSHFRITLHRLIKLGEHYYYQQIARYASTRDDDSEGQIGRTFSIDSGLGGLCCQIRKPITLIRGNGFEELKSHLEKGLTHARPIENQTESFLSVPFFAKNKNGINLLLYADSNNPTFFSDLALRTIYTACKGFVENLEAMLNHKELRLSAPRVGGYVSENMENEQKAATAHRAILTIDHEIFTDFSDCLTFKSVGFFEVT